MITYPTEELKKRLQAKPWFKPIHAKINTKLQEIDPQSHIIAIPHEYINLGRILSEAKIDDSVILYMPLESSQNKENCDFLIAHKLASNIFYGYAMSKDGLWRFHSWGKTGTGEIIETTEPREKYFGCVYL